MAEITPQLVKKLRDKTGAGMGDCKNALTEANGDMDAAIEILRKKGAASAAKRADRSANEGIILVKTLENGKESAIVEVNSETDFVARNQGFVDFAHTVVDTLLSSNAKTIEEVLQLKAGNNTLEQLLNDVLAKFSEKIEIRRFEKINSNGYIADYIHAGSKLAVVIEASIAEPTEKSKVLIRDIAMQIAAMNPMFIDRSKVTDETIAKEKEIYREQAIAEGKKEDIADRIAQGRLEKFYQEQCLVEQTFIKDPNKTVNDVIKEISEDCGQEVKILSFRRYFLGEN